jgi:hypothetical protein
MNSRLWMDQVWRGKKIDIRPIRQEWPKQHFRIFREKIRHCQFSFDFNITRKIMGTALLSILWLFLMGSNQP